MKRLGFESLFSLATAVALTVLLANSATAQLSNYSQDFEGLDRTSFTALSDDGWWLFAASQNGIPGDPTFGDFGVGPFAAPNDIDNPFNSVISDFPSGGDPPAGNQGLVVFTDFNSELHTEPNGPDPRDLIISVFQEQTISAADIGSTVTFDFLAEGNAFPPINGSVAEAFLLTLDPNNGFATTNDLFIDTSNIADGTPTPLSITLDLSDPALAGQILQFGFRTFSQDFNGVAVDYDNIVFTVNAVPEPTSVALIGLATLGLAGVRRRR